MTDVSPTVAIVDVGTGNLRSVSKAIEHVARSASVDVVRDPEKILRADRVVLPGQGAIGSFMGALEDRELRASVVDALTRKPVLGICLGLQGLYEHSSEGGGQDGLAWVKGKVRHFDEVVSDRTLKVPHMGWNNVQQRRPHPMWNNIDDNTRFYFVHSYYADTADDEATVGISEHGCSFTAAMSHENVFATQFHPEKSADAGLALLKNFIQWTPER